jgi:hypothetical protein
VRITHQAGASRVKRASLIGAALIRAALIGAASFIGVLDPLNVHDPQRHKALAPIGEALTHRDGAMNAVLFEHA